MEKKTKEIAAFFHLGGAWEKVKNEELAILQ